MSKPSRKHAKGMGGSSKEPDNKDYTGGVAIMLTQRGAERLRTVGAMLPTPHTQEEVMMRAIGCLAFLASALQDAPEGLIIIANRGEGENEPEPVRVGSLRQLLTMPLSGEIKTHD